MANPYFAGFVPFSLLCCLVLLRRDDYEPHGLAAGFVLARSGDDGLDIRLPGRLREGLTWGRFMIWLTVLVTLFLFIYLLAALLRPEWF